MELEVCKDGREMDWRAKCDYGIWNMTMEYDNEERNDSEDRVGKWAECELGVRG
jgi:hypothetical protein